MSSSALLSPGPATSRASFHTSRVLSNAADKPTEAFLTEEMISAMEYHHEQRDVTDLNLFLKHPSSPKIMAWHPDLIFDGDTIDFIMSHDEMEESLPEEDAMSVVSEPETPSRAKISFLNRNARFGKSKRTVVVVVLVTLEYGSNHSTCRITIGTKASKGKRPCSRQARRRKKRSIGNHRR